MSQIIQAVFFTILGGAISSASGLFIANYRRTKDAKDDFGRFVSTKIGEVPKRDVLGFYKSSKPAIREAVHRFMHYLKTEKRASIQSLWEEYDSVTDQQLDPINEGKMGEVFRDLQKLTNPPTKFNSPHEVVRYYLDEFYKFSA